MFDTLIKFKKDRDKLDFYATDSRAVEEILKVEKFSKVVFRTILWSRSCWESVREERLYS